MCLLVFHKILVIDGIKTKAKENKGKRRAELQLVIDDQFDISIHLNVKTKGEPSHLLVLPSNRSWNQLNEST